MRVLYPDSHPDFVELSNGVFLAGPCPRNPNHGNWRDEAIELFEKLGFDGDLINPTNRSFKDSDYLNQVDWEVKGLNYASVILFWIPRSKNFPGFTTNVEFGEWMSNDNVVLGFPEGSLKNDYPAARFQARGGIVHHTLEDTVLAAIDLVENGWKRHGGNYFFTSDTHFSQERTLELSYRPFKSVNEMDLTLISNWNKRLNSESIIFHLGDFGSFDVLPLLNFKKMFFVKGNYEKDDPQTCRGVFKNRRVYLREPFSVKIFGKTFCFCHEPVDNNPFCHDDFCLYGHIHRTQMVKRNGVNVGVDCNRFNPMSINELFFLRGGVDEHFDENVFSDYCGNPLKIT